MTFWDDLLSGPFGSTGVSFFFGGFLELTAFDPSLRLGAGFFTSGDFSSLGVDLGGWVPTIPSVSAFFRTRSACASTMLEE